MIHLFINALAASAGGGLTYVRNVVPNLEARQDVRATVLLRSDLRDEFVATQRVTFLDQAVSGGTARRFWTEQKNISQLIRSNQADVLISAGNFALRQSPVPQILLSRNSLYTSHDFLLDVIKRRDYRMWFDTRLKAAVAKWSIREATVTVAPTAAFAHALRAWTGVEVAAIHHGFDRETFLSGTRRD